MGRKLANKGLQQSLDLHDNVVYDKQPEIRFIGLECIKCGQEFEYPLMDAEFTGYNPRCPNCKSSRTMRAY